MSKTSYPLQNLTAKAVEAKRLTSVLNRALQDQAPDMGCYVNEADVNQPSFQQAVWGNHYQRLLDIKRRVDPKGIFWCKVCVGAEDWVEADNGTICTRS